MAIQQYCLRLFLALLFFVCAAHAAPETNSRVVAVGDVHGALSNLRIILQRAEVIDAQDRWIGGRAVLVQVGDLLDRGPDGRGVMDLMMSLEKSATESGGKVVSLLGNHEVMNLFGDLRYVTPEDFGKYAGPDSEQRRKNAYQEYVSWLKRSESTANSSPSAPVTEAQWMEQHPPGYVEHFEAFSPKGTYGQWLRTRNTVVEEAGAVFLHGGIDPSVAKLSIEEINRTVQDEIKIFDRTREMLLEDQSILPFFNFPEIVGAAVKQFEVGRRALNELAAARAAGREVDQNKLNALNSRVQQLHDFLEHPKWLSIKDEGPLWFRGFAKWSDSEGAAQIPALLKAYNAKMFVIGHTFQAGGGVRARWGGKVLLIDTGMMQARFPGGEPSAVEITTGRVDAIYRDKRVVVLPSATTTGAAMRAPTVLAEVPSGEPAAYVELQAILDSRPKIIRHVEKRIAERGRPNALFTFVPKAMATGVPQ